MSGLVFGRGGIVGATYKPLMNELTISEIYDVFAHFGISVDLATRSLNTKLRVQVALLIFGVFA